MTGWTVEVIGIRSDGDRANVEQAVVYSTLPQEYSTLTFRGEVVAGGGGVGERNEVMYCIEVRTYIYYKEA